MHKIQLSQTVSTSPASLWQVLIDFEAWPKIFDDIERVRILRSAAPDIELQCTGSDGHVWHEHCTEWQPEKCLQMTVREEDGHPFGLVSRTWTTEQADKHLQLQLYSDYVKPLPLIGFLMARLQGRPSALQHSQSALDSVVHQAREKEWSYQETAQTILNNKGDTIVSALPTDRVEQLCDTMSKHRIGTVLIIDEQEKLVGLVSERDVVYQLSHQGAAVLEKTAAEIMTRDLIVCEPESDLFFVMACITENKIRHLPVIKNDRLIGIISIGDVVKQRIHALEAESETLREYIAAREWRYHNHHAAPAAETVQVSAAE